MRHFLKAVTLVLACMMSNAMAADAGGRASADEAVAMVKKAVAYLKANGKDKAFAEFNNPGGQFVDRNLYIFVYDMNGTCVAIGNNPRMIGKVLIDLRDPDGVFQVRRFIEVANTSGHGWVDYKWPNPVSKVMEAKSSYVEKADEFVIGAGIYK
ncbi:MULTISPECIES: cache domain-containing protein [unclassified Duganella]|uniref:cache domain-containing protein n=1 Tax=unclassified Duganella TaxID=2636909 RepID=UPI000E34CEE4|nr:MULTISPECIES: cache domain-containing protein [unclassified Duganella]RFP15890.1 histidine kinase [Duganella sp. BJB475]RFP32946.1 histidine kinase [Duganella sp. BJB476]